MEIIDVERGLDKTHTFTVTVNGETVPADTLTRVDLVFKPFELTTVSGLTFNANKTAVTAQIGLVDGLAVGSYKGYLLVYDSVNTNGLFAGDVLIKVCNL
jgi:hypothetical protein